MIENFDSIKKQLGELADVLNTFKSEAVQLKIIELVFSGTAGASAVPRTPTPPRKEEQTKHLPAAPPKTTTGKKRAASGSGAIAMLVRLYDSGFFDQPRTINQIVDECGIKLARRIKQHEISGKLARMVRGSVLERKKNSDGQYEYTKPK